MSDAEVVRVTAGRSEPLPQPGAVVTESPPTYDQSPEGAVGFRWSDPREDYLIRLRAECPRVVRELAERDELVAVAALATWVHLLWDHSGVHEGSANDPIAIIQRARHGESFRCVEYAAVLSGCLNALGIPARSIALKKHDVETAASQAGHVAAEAYLSTWRRWIFIDVQFNFIAWHDGPLDAVTLRHALDGATGVSNAGLVHFDQANYLAWLKPYLFYMDVRLDNRVGVADRSPHSLMLVPIGAPRPAIMQRRWLIEETSCTHSVGTFYPVPHLGGESSVTATTGAGDRTG
jgi:hypothetical protein